jgi:hypothetical protein
LDCCIHIGRVTNDYELFAQLFVFTQTVYRVSNRMVPAQLIQPAQICDFRQRILSKATPVGGYPPHDKKNKKIQN